MRTITIQTNSTDRIAGYGRPALPFFLVVAALLSACTRKDPVGLPYSSASQAPLPSNDRDATKQASLRQAHAGAISTALAGAAAAGKNLRNHGGRVMGDAQVYLLWYGNWAAEPASFLIPALVQGLDSAPWWRINHLYGDGAGDVAGEHVRFAGEHSVVPRVGETLDTDLTDDDVKSIVARAIAEHDLPLSPNGIYVVLGAPEIHQDGFCTSHCGWHTHATLEGQDIKYAFVGNAATQCPRACGVEAVSPNGTGAGDAMANVLAHELAETVTDSDIDAWYDDNGSENADLCAWTFGSTQSMPSTARWNVCIGDRRWRIQQNWALGDGERCALWPIAEVAPSDACCGGGGDGSLCLTKSYDGQVAVCDGDELPHMLGVALTDSAGRAMTAPTAVTFHVPSNEGCLMSGASCVVDVDTTTDALGHAGVRYKTPTIPKGETMEFHVEARVPGAGKPAVVFTVVVNGC